MHSRGFLLPLFRLSLKSSSSHLGLKALRSRPYSCSNTVIPVDLYRYIIIGPALTLGFSYRIATAAICFQCYTIHDFPRNILRGEAPYQTSKGAPCIAKSAAPYAASVWTDSMKGTCRWRVRIAAQLEFIAPPPVVYTCNRGVAPTCCRS
jgi:hypothetical protein